MQVSETFLNLRLSAMMRFFMNLLWIACLMLLVITAKRRLIMLGTLGGFTGLWSAPATKYIVGAAIAGAAWLYVSGLNDQIEKQQLMLENKTQQLISKQAEVVSLTASVEQANNATKIALLEIENREQLAAQRLNKIAELRDQLTNFEQSLNELEQTDAQVKSWADEPVPDAVIRLLDNARNQNSNDSSGEEDQTTSAVNAGLSVARVKRTRQSRFNQTDWQVVPVYSHLQF